MFNRKILLGTRTSGLALFQANWVKRKVLNIFPNLKINLVKIKTKGDKFLNISLSKVGGKGLFVKEIEEELLNGYIDVAVHSMKDMPIDITKGLCIASVPEREDPRDILIYKKNFSIHNIDKIRLGTSSLRRISQFLSFRSNVEVVPIRGNVQTRLDKIKKDSLDVIVLAAAGLIRLGLEKFISEYLSFETMLPAVGQGALCIQTREDDYEIIEIFNAINHEETRLVVTAERSFLHRLSGNCHSPIAANAILKNNKIYMQGLISNFDGSNIIKKELFEIFKNPEEVGKNLAELILFSGGKNIIEEISKN